MILVWSYAQYQTENLSREFELCLEDKFLDLGFELSIFFFFYVLAISISLSNLTISS